MRGDPDQRETERERRLLDRARSGDEQAFQGLFQIHAPALLGSIRKGLPGGLGRKVSSADLLQEVRIAAYRALPGFEPRGEGALRGWLLKIAEHRVQTAIRRYVQTAKRSQRSEVSRPGRPQTGAFPGAGPSPSEAAVAAESRRNVRERLTDLPDDYREVLDLVFREQLTLREVGERMGRSREAAKKLYRRALAKFAEAMQEEGPDEQGRLGAGR